MSESTEPHPEKERKWPMRLAKTVFFIAAFLLVIFTVMANMGGSSDTMKGAIEDYLSRATGYQTHIGTLNRMAFFPTITVDIEDVDMRRDTDPEPAIMAGHVEIAMSFVDAMFNTGKIKRFNVEHLSALPGAILTQALYIDQAHINDDASNQEEGGDTAFFEGLGQIGQSNLSFQADMKAYGGNGHRTYKFPQAKPFTIALNNLGLQGTLQTTEKTLRIENLRARLPEEVLAGNVEFTRADAHKTHVLSDVKISGRTDLHADLVIDRTVKPWNVTGTVISQDFNAADFAKGSPLQRFTTGLMSALGREEQSIWALSAAQITLDLKAAKTVQAGKDAGPVDAHITFTDDHLDLGALQAVLDAEPVVTPSKPVFGPYRPDAE